ncbi:MAG: DNA polymerase III subunit alpha, partial [Snodgrassella alvi]|nr:DNA polymerase III subunit alpha [Snodgrassella alvi]
EYGASLKADQVLIMECKVAVDEYNGGDGLRITADDAFTLAQASARYARSLQLYIAADAPIQKLAALLKTYCGEQAHVPLKFCCRHQQAYGELRADKSWLIRPEAALFDSLYSLLGDEAVQVSF